MAKKENLRKVWSVFYWLLLFYLTVKFLLGKADTFSTVCLFVSYSLWTLYLILRITLKIIRKVISYKSYKQYKQGFEYLQAVHKARYKLYFTGKSEDIESYSAEIERYGSAMLDVGEYYVSNNVLSESQIKEVQEILDQTKKMMATVN